ncbi:hypothetical protein NDA14_004004 [Ustilago hordei]|uniref:Mediator of RNA polymerase II transcription subunit 11 n=1 Tax=Ustilago hordei TaxID=120017 RepID=I2FNL7_USTHO|nr:uncharacterized protein UHO2_07198 [Ustilago hordei]KAJ1039635.1 hypothetical protein NDA10_007260 [Ustilago hordei]KAJ1570160.1 hypothetical protein NDA12_000141 [Ustilago hordei]KAJ1572174.1 hypothetical protein NDA15_006455 [Ustilago hordei]KAJ1594609.1 hypothetical protein NDA14_004004 [Ustilago hordei]UTT92822.1 hypothetical protein NDA17_002561 [Ustilago hordei]
MSETITTQASTSTSTEVSDMLLSDLQNTIMEKKFAQIRAQRQDAQNVLHEAKQRTRNQQTDQQILLLMQADERLASLLPQAADSMRALLRVTPSALDAVQLTAAEPETDAEPAKGAKAFEQRAQQWFSILNEVQYSLRSAVRYLRDAQLSPLTAPATASARTTGKAGSTARGHNLSLLDAFVDLSGLDGTTFKLPPANPSSSSSRSSTMGSNAPLEGLPESNLSLQALRERERNWKALSGSLQQIKQSTKENPGSPNASKVLATPFEVPLLESIRNAGCSSDRILLDALVNTGNMAQ